MRHIMTFGCVFRCSSKCLSVAELTMSGDEVSIDGQRTVDDKQKQQTEEKARGRLATGFPKVGWYIPKGFQLWKGVPIPIMLLRQVLLVP